MVERARQTGYRGLLTLAAFVVVVAGLRAAEPILVPLLLAVFLTVLAAPLVLWLERHRVPAPIAVTVPVLLAIGALAGFGALLATSVSDLDEALGGYQHALTDAVNDLAAWLSTHGLRLSTDAMADVLDPSDVMSYIGSFVGGLITAVSNTALVVLSLVFMLLEVAGFSRKLRAAMRDPKADLTQIVETLHAVQRYLAIKTAISLLTGFVVWLWLEILGVDFPILWGLVAFLLNYIPNVGSIIAAIPAVLVAIVQPGLGFGYATLVAAGYVVINTLIGNLLEPQVMGRRLGLSPMVVFISLVVWGWVWGPIGMLLSVPLTMAFRLMLERSEDFYWVSVLLGPAPSHDEDETAESASQSEPKPVPQPDREPESSPKGDPEPKPG